MSPYLLALSLALAAAPVKKAPAPKGPTLVKATISPAAAVLFVDGQRKGTGTKTHTIKLTPGKHVFKVVYKKDAHEELVVVKANQTTAWSWSFEDDKPIGHGGGGAPSDDKPDPQLTPPAPAADAPAPADTPPPAGDDTGGSKGDEPQ